MLSKELLLEKRIEIGKKIAELRKEKGLSQTDLAEQLGITRHTIGKIENADWNFTVDLVNNILAFFEHRIVIEKFK